MPSNNSDVCRLCLSVDVLMFPIAGTPLQLAYEKISNATLHTSDKRPLMVCYICNAHLKRCSKLMQMSAKAEMVLTTVLQKYNKITKETVTLIGHQAKELNRKLTYSLPDGIDTTLPPATVEVKIEPDLEDELYSDTNNVQIQTTELQDVLVDNTAPGVEIKTEHLTEYSNITIVEIKTEEVSDIVQSNSECEDAPLSPDAVVSDVDVEHMSDLEDTALFKEIRFGHNSDRLQMIGKLEPDIETGGACSKESKHKKRKQAVGKSANTSRKRAHTDFECEVCQHQFHTIFHLRTHIRTHTGEKPHKCNFCQRGFSYQSSLLKHVVIHTGEKPYKCNICLQRFNRKHSLKRHSVTHTSNKPFECKVCHSGFPDKTGLKCHLLSHSDERRFECDVCHSRFNYKHVLAKHFKTHTGEKPYECNICQRRFADKFNLKTHRTKMHNKSW